MRPVMSYAAAAVVCRVRRGRCAVRENEEVEFGDFGDDFEEQTQRHRYDHTVNKQEALGLCR